MPIRFAYPPYPVGWMSKEILRGYVEGDDPVTGKPLMQEMVDALTNPLTEDEKNPKVVLGFDVLAPEGYGEIIGGSEREPDLEKVKARLVEQGENPDDYDFYLDTRKYGSVPHGGFGMGVERVIAWICKLENIKDAIAFPRTMTRFYP